MFKLTTIIAVLGIAGCTPDGDYWCQKQPTITDVRVCMSTKDGCTGYGGNGECFNQTGAWCIWRAGFTGVKDSLCTPTKGECERNRARVPPDAKPTPCFQALSSAETN